MNYRSQRQLTMLTLSLAIVMVVLSSTHSLIRPVRAILSSSFEVSTSFEATVSGDTGGGGVSSSGFTFITPTNTAGQTSVTCASNTSTSGSTTTSGTNPGQISGGTCSCASGETAMCSTLSGGGNVQQCACFGPDGAERTGNFNTPTPSSSATSTPTPTATSTPIPTPASNAPAVSNVAIAQPDYCTSGPGGTVTWTYSSPDGSTEDSYQVQVATDTAFANIVVDSGKIHSSSTAYNILQGVLQFNTTYYTRVRVWDSRGLVSNWK